MSQGSTGWGEGGAKPLVVRPIHPNEGGEDDSEPKDDPRKRERQPQNKGADATEERVHGGDEGQGRYQDNAQKREASTPGRR